MMLRQNLLLLNYEKNAALMSIITKKVPVEFHQTKGILERYHSPLRRAYKNITYELK